MIKKIKNRKISNVTLQDNSYNIVLPIRKDYLNDYEEYYFTLEIRGKPNFIRQYLKSSIKTSTEEYLIFNLSFSLSNDYFSSENEILDVYLNRKENGEVKKNRIKSEGESLRFLAIVFPEQKKMFYPFTTRHGNLSFYFNDYYLFANFDEAIISKDGINFSGYFIFAPMFYENGYKIINKKLILINNLDDTETIIPLDTVKRTDILDKHNGNYLLKQTGFKGNFDFDDIKITERKKYCKFYLELTYEKNGVVETIRSTRMRYEQKEQKMGLQSSLISYHGTKFRVEVKPTKKSKYLSLQMSQYNFKNELVTKLRSQWIKLRRSKSIE